MESDDEDDTGDRTLEELEAEAKTKNPERCSVEERNRSQYEG
jgi:hypothetical protein